MDDSKPSKMVHAIDGYIKMEINLTLGLKSRVEMYRCHCH